MTLPQFVVRSYAGGAVAAQLAENIGATDTSFGITTTVGWTESVGANIGQPLGTSGPFEIVIDRFTDTAEKILCQSVNLTTGLVTVWPGGRGYDGSTGQAHVPNGSTSGVQVTWAADEAYEANKLVAALLGGSPSVGEILVWNGSAPAWGATGSLTGNPAGTMAATGQTIVPSGTGSTTQITSLVAVTGSLKGGVTVASNALTVPVTGPYNISWVIKWQASGGGVTEGSTDYQALINLNGTQILSASVPGLTGSNPSPGASVVYPLNANDVLTLSGYQDSSVNEASVYTGQITPGLATWVSVSLVSE